MNQSVMSLQLTTLPDAAPGHLLLDLLLASLASLLP